ncbi:MAG: prepilin-type N-terminal cleavage/methylation domain-containing protein [Deltaproteobacteria bacterium]|nr:prepilin-type N-terminal cleavage/methylation domain-containing protein [Deltaproteobacteria bacterium]
MATDHKGRQGGFTLVEILVTLALTGIVTAGLVNFMVSQSRSYNVQENVQEMEQNARVAMDYLVGGLQRTQSLTLKHIFTDHPRQGDGVLLQDGVVYRFNQGTDLYSSKEDKAGRISVSGTGAGNGFIASFITQDLTGDGIPDTPMFQVDNPVNPHVVTVTIIARTRRADPRYKNNNGYRQIVLTRRVVLRNM